MSFFLLIPNPLIPNVLRDQSRGTKPAYRQCIFSTIRIGINEPRRKMFHAAKQICHIILTFGHLKMLRRGDVVNLSVFKCFTFINAFKKVYE